MNDLIIQALEKKNFSINRFCKIHGYSMTYMNAVVTRLITPPLGQTIAICQKLGFTIKEVK